MVANLETTGNIEPSWWVCCGAEINSKLNGRINKSGIYFEALT
jgi:hypothetical protein